MSKVRLFENGGVVSMQHKGVPEIEQDIRNSAAWLFTRILAFSMLKLSLVILSIMTIPLRGNTFFTIDLYAQGEIKVNQVGFYPTSQKIAIVPVQVSGEFELRKASTGETVYRNMLSQPRQWPHSAEIVAIADFSDFETVGEYYVYHNNLSSYAFQIATGVHHELMKASWKYFYFNRASTALRPEYAGRWARPAGHPDDRVLVHYSAATEKRPTGYVISAPKGWYDAGDFNKYVVNSGISTYTLMAAYEHFPEFYRGVDLNIPESGNGIPDILDEIRWNLDWMIEMQDPDDGGVYHKLTTLNFAGMIMPHLGRATRYVVMKSTAATLNFAAIMATAARVYGPYDEDFALRALDAAIMAWQWANENPAVYYVQPPDVFTGQYGDRNVSDEFDWAAVELYITTRNEEYWNARNIPAMGVGVPAWPYVRPLAWVSLGHHRHDLTPVASVSLIENRLINQANILRNHYRTSAYRVSKGHVNGDFVWGSNGVAANHGLMLIQAYRITGDEEYLDAAVSLLDYLLGRNATGYSFVTGFGSKPPMHPHHRASAADGIRDPVPGMLVGGPHSGQQDGCPYPSNLRALSYLDSWCSYSTNEVAINWNAPLAYLSGAIEFFKSQEVSTSLREPTSLPNGIRLEQNYPNPFNPATIIRFELHEHGFVELTVHDTLGRRVAELVRGEISAGIHSVEFDASQIPSGVYIYSLRDGYTSISKKLLVLK